jgi:hypothetical protein
MLIKWKVGKGPTCPLPKGLGKCEIGTPHSYEGLGELIDGA